MRQYILVLLLVLAVPALWMLNLRRAVCWYWTSRGLADLRKACRLLVSERRAAAKTADRNKAIAGSVSASPGTVTSSSAASGRMTTGRPVGSSVATSLSSSCIAVSCTAAAPRTAPLTSGRVFAKARQAFLKGRFYHRNNPYTLLFLGICDLLQGKRESGGKFLERFTSLHPEDFGVAARAWLRYKGDPGTDPFRGLDLSEIPLSPHSAVFASWAALHRNDIPTVRQLLLRARRAADLSPAFHYVSALADIEEGRIKKAFENLRKARALAFSSNRINNYAIELDAFDCNFRLAEKGVRCERGPWRGTIIPFRRLAKVRSAEMLYNLAVLNYALKKWNRCLFLLEILKKNYPDSVSDTQKHPDFIRLSYPLAFAAAVRNNAETYNLDPALVFAVMRQESKFNVKIRSNKAATGLMQITPDTARWICARMKTRYHEKMTENPETNIRLGCWLLNHLRSKFRDRETCWYWVLAAYNAGRGNAERWMKRWKRRGRKLSPLRYIAYRETKDYVAKVYDAWGVYKKICSNTKTFYTRPE